MLYMIYVFQSRQTPAQYDLHGLSINHHHAAGREPYDLHDPAQIDIPALGL